MVNALINDPPSSVLYNNSRQKLRREILLQGSIIHNEINRVGRIWTDKGGCYLYIESYFYIIGMYINSSSICYHNEENTGMLAGYLFRGISSHNQS